MLENKFQSHLIERLKFEFPGCVILKNDPNYIQGMPDLIILYSDKWVMLEVKKSKNANRQPNQEYYIKKLNNMSYANFIYPENEEEVLYEVHKALGA